MELIHKTGTYIMCSGTYITCYIRPW